MSANIGRFGAHCSAFDSIARFGPGTAPPAVELDVEIDPWPPERAARGFLARFGRLA